MSIQENTKKKPHKISIVIDNSNQKFELIKDLGVQEKKSSPELKASFNDEYNKLVSKLDGLVGLNDVKNLLLEIFAFNQINHERVELGLKTEPQVFHMLFKGNPGTGKTTVARIIAEMFHDMGILSKGHIVEVERADLVGEYIGHTAQKTREHIKKALGGILFIDEAYSLLRGGEKDFGRESIDALVKAMEDHKNDFILILAGYNDEMEDLLESNSGLNSRFPIQLQFKDYNINQLMEIAEVMVQEREYYLSNSAKNKLKEIIIEDMGAEKYTFSNARLVRNLIESSIRSQAVRLIKNRGDFHSKKMLMTIQAEDFLKNKVLTKYSF